MNTQSSAWRSGVLFNNLGAYLLELGRTMMTLRMGQNPVCSFLPFLSPWFPFNLYGFVISLFLCFIIWMVS